MNIFFAWLLAFAPLAAYSPRKLSLLEWIVVPCFWLAGADRRALCDLVSVYHRHPYRIHCSPSG